MNELVNSFLSSRGTRLIMQFREGFKKGLNRAGTTILQKTGAVDKTIDPEFEAEERRLKGYRLGHNDPANRR